MKHGPTKLYFDLLTEVLKPYKPVRVLELGTGWGISGSAFLDAGCELLVTVDPNMTAPYVQKSLAELEARRANYQTVVALNVRSENLTRGVFKDAGLGEDPKFDVIFVDARHDYESVRIDLLTAKNFLSKGGMIICDDFSHPKNQIDGENAYGVQKAVLEYIELGMVEGFIEDWYPRMEGNGLAVIIHK